MQSVKDEVMVAYFKITPMAMGVFDSLLVWNHTPPGWNPGLKEPPLRLVLSWSAVCFLVPQEIFEG